MNFWWEVLKGFSCGKLVMLVVYHIKESTESVTSFFIYCLHLLYLTSEFLEADEGLWVVSGGVTLGHRFP